jgi:uncharacterized membrane protein YraQ (UPF0718 family)/copper chaperone CopZ
LAELLSRIVVACWLVLGQMAPYLLFGFLVAGLLSVCISPEWVERHLGRRGFGPVLKASLFGVPLPLCSCGVIPVAASLHRHGASRAATTSFLLSTPQTGVDSIAVTYALLGPLYAVFRPIAALATGLLGGGLVQLFAQRGEPAPNHRDHAHAAADCQEACCAGRNTQHIAVRALRYGLVTLPRDIGAALLVGVVIAGAIGALFPEPPEQLQPYLGGGLLAMLLMAAVGIPIYVCASASVPIAAGFIHLGASPGAALAFLIAGPATNGATITTVWKLLGRRTALLYLSTIAVAAVGCGLLLDWLFAATAATPPHLAMHEHGEMTGWQTHAWAIALLAVLAFSYFSRGLSRFSSQRKRDCPPADVAESPDAVVLPLERIELTIAGMTCEHCVAGATRALRACEGVVSADVTLKPGRAAVRGSRLDPRLLIAALAELGYTAGELNRAS